MVAGGLGLGRSDDGRVVLVEGAIPGEIVSALITEDRPTLVRGRVDQVLDRSPHRRSPPCPKVAEGCGGCDWQHIEPAAAADMKRSIAVDALARIGRMGREAAEALVDGQVERAPEEGYRTTMRCAVTDDGRLGLRRPGSHDVVAIGACPVAHPSIRHVLETTRLGSSDAGVVGAGSRRPSDDDVVVRHGTADGRIVVGIGASHHVEHCPPGVELVTSSSAKSRRDGGPSRGRERGRELGVVHEAVGDVTFEVSPDSFFQSGPDAAALLVTAVSDAISATVGRASLLVDLYGGVGLFACAVPADAALVVEQSRSASHDAMVNLRASGRRGSVVHVDVERWQPGADERLAPLLAARTGPLVAVADPARTGLGAKGVETIVALGPDLVVLVSCDPAAGARDVALLAAAGFVAVRAAVLDLFPSTHHLELVTALVPAPDATPPTRSPTPVPASAN